MLIFLCFRLLGEGRDCLKPSTAVAYWACSQSKSGLHSGGGSGKRGYFARVKGKIEARGSQIMKESLACMKTWHFSKRHTESTGNEVTIV